jgi:hypothetical protein
VFLAGERAYKLKTRGYGSTISISPPPTGGGVSARRKRRHESAHGAGDLSPVAAVTAEADGSLALDGRGSAIDWLGRDEPLSAEALFDRMAGAGRLDLA